jgi:hypothetical protein
MARRFFFNSTINAHQKLSTLFDFVWPSACASWNMRHQVAGYLAVVPAASDLELKGRFIAGSKISGVNLKRAFVERSWDDHLNWFSDNLLTSLFPLYEAWADDILHELAMPVSKLAAEMQFPSGATKLLPSGKRTKPKIGVGGVIAQITRASSPFTTSNVYPRLAKNNGYSFPELENLLVAYRYFKEARNCRIHSGGRASDDAVDAYNAFALVANEKAINVKKFHPPTPVVKGAAVTVDLRSVVGFGELLMNIFATLDAELARCGSAENVLLNRWRSALGAAPLAMSTKAAKRHGKIHGFIKRHRLPNTASVKHLDGWLQANGLIRLA